MPTIRHVFPCGLLVLLFTCPASAGPLQDGLEASRRGDYAEAYCLWRSLADAGDAEAQYRLGWLYANGQGLRINPSTAVDWWIKAAEQGHGEAQFSVARAYSRGKGVKKDRSKALQWYLAAARNGMDDARELLRESAARGDPETTRLVSRLLREGDWKVLGAPVQVSGDKVNLRQGPSTRDPVITRLPKHQTVLELGRTKKWVRIGVVGSGEVGWVYAKYVETTG